MKRCKRFFLGFIIILCFFERIYAGPPFYTDDPAPVEHRHWEYYISSINGLQNQFWSGTLPHLEVNYGVVPNVQIHLLLPMNYSYGQNVMNMGYSNTEIGVKYRFIKETDHMPQVGVFPIIELPTIKNKNFGNGKAQIYLPLWLQKSWGKLTTYGGGGYWINPGVGTKNWLFTGWELQYDFSSVLTLGGELYFHTSPDIDTKSASGFNLGGFVNFSPKFHFIFSAGHGITNGNFFSSYVGVLWTI